MKKIVNIKNAPKPIGPYSQAVLVNNTLFVSGQIPIDPFTGKLVDTNIEAQTTQVLENIKAILKEAKMGMDNVVKASIFLSDLNNFKAINEIYATYFSSNPPARETIEVARLPMDVDIEMSVIAVG
ncbi:MAG: RidA family protein [Bacteroidota bacterium]|nr:RidA family protein [Bacteroidota bacterium]